MVNTLSGSVSAYRNETIRKRYIRVDDAMSMLDVSKEEALEIALAAGARYQLAKITLIHKERLMEFMKHFTRVPSSNKIVEKKFVSQACCICLHTGHKSVPSYISYQARSGGDIDKRCGHTLQHRLLVMWPWRP